jgi:hypothetical protein
VIPIPPSRQETKKRAETADRRRVPDHVTTMAARMAPQAKMAKLENYIKRNNTPGQE